MISHSQVQAALSSRVDGEASELDDAVVDAHVAHCEQCRTYGERLASLSRATFAEDERALEPPRDLASSILAGVEDEYSKLVARRLARLAIARVALAVLAAAYFVWAGLLVADSTRYTAGAAADGVAPIDGNPEMASLLIGAAAVRVGVGVALLFAAWKPKQLLGVLIITGAMLGFTLGFSVLDAVSGASQMPWAQLVTLAVTCLALVGLWVADRGLASLRGWRKLSANPF